MGAKKKKTVALRGVQCAANAELNDDKLGRGSTWLSEASLLQTASWERVSNTTGSSPKNLWVKGKKGNF